MLPAQRRGIKKSNKPLKIKSAKACRSYAFTAAGKWLRLNLHSQQEAHFMTKKSIRYNTADLACRCMR